MFQQYFNDVPMMLQQCFNNVSTMFQRCFNDVSTMFQGCSEDVLRKSNWCFIGFEWYFLDCFKGVMGVSFLSYGCFKCFLFVLKSSQLTEHKEGLFPSKILT